MDPHINNDPRRGNNWVLPDPWRWIYIRAVREGQLAHVPSMARWKHALTHFMHGYLPLGGRFARWKKQSSKGKGEDWVNKEGRIFNARNYSLDPQGEKADVVYFIPRLQNRAANAIKYWMRRRTNKIRCEREHAMKDVFRQRCKWVSPSVNGGHTYFEDLPSLRAHVLGYL